MIVYTTFPQPTYCFTGSLSDFRNMFVPIHVAIFRKSTDSPFNRARQVLYQMTYSGDL